MCVCMCDYICICMCVFCYINGKSIIRYNFESKLIHGKAFL